MLGFVRGPHFGRAEAPLWDQPREIAAARTLSSNRKQREFAAVLSVDRDLRLLSAITQDILYDVALLRASLERNFRKGAPKARLQPSLSLGQRPRK
jgi:hypothetical protein